MSLIRFQRVTLGSYQTWPFLGGGCEGGWGQWNLFWSTVRYDSWSSCSQRQLGTVTWSLRWWCLTATATNDWVCVSDFCRSGVSLRRPCPSGGHCQRGCISEPSFLAPTQQQEHKVLQGKAYTERGTLKPRQGRCQRLLTLSLLVYH